MAVRAPRPGVNPAKLVVPDIDRSAVRRAALLRRLSAESAPVVALVAPAGYGKTTALAQWARGSGRQIAWLSIDAHDNEPTVFLEHLVAALDLTETVGDEVIAALDGQGHLPLTNIVPRVIAAIHRRNQPVLVVLDDAHHVADQGTVDVLVELVDYLPAECQVALSARGEARLPFARWRASRSLAEFGLEDLAFSTDEAASLFAAEQEPISLPAARRITSQTDGWPAMLGLVALAHRRATAAEEPSVVEARGWIDDYVRSEVLGRQSPEDLTFLTRTAVLTTMTAPMCDAVTGVPGSAAALNRLERSTRLVIRYGADTDEPAYRYHSLLRDSLLAELASREPELRPELHRRAAEWCRTHDALFEGVDHAFEARDVDLAASLIGAALLGLHNSGRRAVVLGWLRRMSDADLEQRPWLAVQAAFQEIGAGADARAEHLAGIADRATFMGRPPDGTASFESGRAILRAMLCRNGPADALEQATFALAQEGPSSRWRPMALWVAANAHLAMGDDEAADVMLTDAVGVARVLGHALVHQAALAQRALLAEDRGDWRDAAEWVRESRAVARAARMEGYLATIMGCAAQARVDLHHGDARSARRMMLEAAQLRTTLSAGYPAQGVLALIGLTKAALGLGDAAEAHTILNEARDIVAMRRDLGSLPDRIAATQALVDAAPSRGAGPTSLTAAELRVLPLLPTYLTVADIAERIGVSRHTIKSHVVSIYGKLDATSRREAVERAIEIGLIPDYFAGEITRRSTPQRDAD